MDRFAVLVDAGYLLRQALAIVSRKASVRRDTLEILDPQGLADALVSVARKTLSIPNERELLRVYWYDGILDTGMTPQQKTIAQLPDLLFRGGTVNAAKKQKGVDSLIVTDLLELATNHAICDAAIVTGDGDLAIGLDLSQRKGVKVAVIGVEDFSVGVTHHQSAEITNRADRVARMGAADFAGCFQYKQSSAASSVASGGKTAASNGAPVVSKTASKASVSSLDAASQSAIDVLVADFISFQATLAHVIDPSTQRIDQPVDAALIHHVYVGRGHGGLSNEERKYARAAFRAKLISI